jgi:hypothetical protein
VSVLDRLVEEVDPESPVVVILWRCHDGSYDYVWDGAPPETIVKVLHGALRQVQADNLPAVEVIEPHGTIQ